MNRKYHKNIEKQKEIRRKIEELQLKQELLKEEQDEMEEIEILREYRSIHISLEEFLDMMRQYKKERQEERKNEKIFTSSLVEKNEKNRIKIEEETNEMEK